jgi:hypothetical protein
MNDFKRDPQLILLILVKAYTSVLHIKNELMVASIPVVVYLHCDPSLSSLVIVGYPFRDKAEFKSI